MGSRERTGEASRDINYIHCRGGVSCMDRSLFSWWLIPEWLAEGTLTLAALQRRIPRP